jgi:hypothetical protein
MKMDWRRRAADDTSCNAHGVQAILHIGNCEKNARRLGKVPPTKKTIEDVIRSAQAQVTVS